MLKRFSRGGIHPPENKLSSGRAIERMPLPATVVVPLSQHIGAPATLTVAKGDKVLAGQLIAKGTGFVSANVHAPVSGTVTGVDAVPDAGGVRRPAVTIAVEGDEWAEGIDLGTELDAENSMTPEMIVAMIAEAGIVGMGGATFPSHVKLSLPPGKKAEYLIINGVECEPWLTADHRVMLEHGNELLIGINLLARALGVGMTYIGIENNKPDAIAGLQKLVENEKLVEVVPLRVMYPQGGEKQLIEAVLHREVPSGGLPIDVGAVVHNVGTALAVYQAVQKRKPLVERVVTVTGPDLQNPSNLLVRIGTPIVDLLQHCGGIPEGTAKVISGGPMMGRAIANLDAPVTKGTSGIIVVPESRAHRPAEQACIKCARCVSVCPMGLEPYYLYKTAAKPRYDLAEEAHVTDCIECGSCAFTCPANLPLLDRIRIAKAEVMKAIRARKS